MSLKRSGGGRVVEEMLRSSKPVCRIAEEYCLLYTGDVHFISVFSRGNPIGGGSCITCAI